jgi:succinylglutamic semialdehyde dehydrogenase
MQIFRSHLRGEPKPSSQVSGEWPVQSPVKPDQALGKVGFCYSEIDQAVEEAIKDGRPAGVFHTSGAGFIHETHRALMASKEVIYQWVADETGRTESDFEIEYVQTLLYLTSLTRELPSISVHDPIGVTAVIGSSIWPLFYSLQFALSNLWVGNPVILKPAERTTTTVLKFFELLRQVSPEWAKVQVLVGDREVGRRLSCHQGVQLVIFQGSFEVGMRVKQDTLHQPGKEVLLFLGAKNPHLVLREPNSADYDVLIQDAFLGAGQNCLSAPVILMKRDYFKAFIHEFHERSKKFKIGGPGEGAFMGPLGDPSHLDRYQKFIGISEREGAEIIMRGKTLGASGKGSFMTPTLAVFEKLTPEEMRKSVSLQTEILAPLVSIIQFQEAEEAIGILDRLSYGHSCGIWGDPASEWDLMGRRLQFGSIKWNGSLYSLDPWRGVQVRKKSGNYAKTGSGLFSQLTREKRIE